MQPKVLKFLLDIESIIQEIELVKASVENDFLKYQRDIILQRAVVAR